MKKFNEIIDNYKSKLDDVVFPDNIIIYSGNDDINYKESLHIIKKYSNSNLNYDKKIIVEFNNNEYIYRISDVHIEIDFIFLGCIAKGLWDKIFEQIQLISNLKKNFFILCKNFSNINNDLLDIFYVYLNNSNIRYIFLTNTISMIPDSILNCSNIIRLKNKKNTLILNESLENMKSILENKNISEIRNLLYDLLIYQIDTYAFLYEILNYSFNNYTISDEKKLELLNNLSTSLKYFNNNYRSIYHLEYWIISIINIIN